jgi:hypothetical protein
VLVKPSSESEIKDEELENVEKNALPWLESSKRGFDVVVSI